MEGQGSGRHRQSPDKWGLGLKVNKSPPSHAIRLTDHHQLKLGARKLGLRIAAGG